MTDGELFSRIYGERGAPTRDSGRFRVRLFGHLQSRDHVDWFDISSFFRKEAGVDVAGHSIGWSEFFTSATVADVLDFVSIERRRLVMVSGDAEPRMQRYYAAFVVDWVNFVSRVFREENLGYVFHDGSVKYFVDEDFERSRVSAIAALDVPQLQAVRDAYETAHRYLDPGTRDTKASVRSAFEALEILAKLMYPDQSRLNRNLVLQQLRPDVQRFAADETARTAVGEAIKGLADIVEGAHEYRHGQRVEEAVAPPLDYAVFFLSTIAAAIRYVVPLWTAKQTDPVGQAVAQALAKPSRPQ